LYPMSWMINCLLVNPNSLIASSLQGFQQKTPWKDTFKQGLWIIKFSQTFYI
jgi:hypothetical protein